MFFVLRHEPLRVRGELLSVRLACFVVRRFERVHVRVARRGFCFEPLDTLRVRATRRTVRRTVRREMFFVLHHKPFRVRGAQLCVRGELLSVLRCEPRALFLSVLAHLCEGERLLGETRGEPRLGDLDALALLRLVHLLELRPVRLLRESGRRLHLVMRDACRFGAPRALRDDETCNE